MITLKEYINKLESGKTVTVDTKQLLAWLKTAKPEVKERLDAFKHELEANDIKLSQGLGSDTEYNFGVTARRGMTRPNRDRIIYRAASINDLNVEFTESNVISVTEGSDNPMGDAIRLVIDSGLEVTRYNVECMPGTSYDYYIECSNTNISKKVCEKLIDGFRKIGFKARLVSKTSAIIIMLTHFYNLSMNELESFSSRVDKFEICVKSLLLKYEIEMIQASYDHNNSSAVLEFGGSIPTKGVINAINGYANKYGFNTVVVDSDDEVTKITVL